MLIIIINTHASDSHTAIFVCSIDVVMIYLDSAQFGAGNEDIWLDDVSCIGTENSIFKCKILLDYHDCDHNQDLGIQCTNDTKTGTISVVQ